MVAKRPSKLRALIEACHICRVSAYSPLKAGVGFKTMLIRGATKLGPA